MNAATKPKLSPPACPRGFGFFLDVERRGDGEVFGRRSPGQLAPVTPLSKGTAADAAFLRHVAQDETRLAGVGECPQTKSVRFDLGDRIRWIAE